MILSILICPVISPSLLSTLSLQTNMIYSLWEEGVMLYTLFPISPSSTVPSLTHHPWTAWMSGWLMKPPLPLPLTPVRLFMKLLKIKNGLVSFDTVDSIFSRIAILLVFHISHNCTTDPVSPARNTGDTVNLPPLLHLIRHQMLSIPPQKQLLHSPIPLWPHYLCHGLDPFHLAYRIAQSPSSWQLHSIHICERTEGRENAFECNWVRQGNLEGQ